MGTAIGDTLEIYVKNTGNVPGGMPLTVFVAQSETWEGQQMRLPFGEEDERTIYTVQGWTDLVHSNPYPDVVRGCPTTVYCTKVQAPEGQIGYLIYGGNSGLRVGGRNGWGLACVWVDEADAATDLPRNVQQVVLQ